MFTVLATGDWSIDQIHVRRSGVGRVIVPEVEEAIEHEWQRRMATPGIVLFDGPMARLVSFHAAPKRLDLELSETSYKPFVGTNMAHPEFADQFGREVMANPLGVSPLLVTADGYLLLGRRRGTLAYYPGRIHPFAGAMEPKDPGPIEAVRRELREELRLDHRDVADVRCTGIVEDPMLRQCEMIFVAYSTKTRDALIAKLDDDEHQDAWSIPATSDAVIDALKVEESLTPVARAAMLLWGRLKFGHAWFEDQYDRVT